MVMLPRIPTPLPVSLSMRLSPLLRKTILCALGRRIAIGGRSQRRLHEAERELIGLLEQQVDEEDERVLALRREIHHLRTRLLAIPYLDPFDLRYSNRIRVPKPSTQAVMFCLLDVSGSMDESRKDMAKRFFILLYLFLSRMYEHTQVVFIRHHTQAAEVTEDEFFHATESGGTVVSSALTLMHQLVRERYSGSEWNIYGAQASDGDNWQQDSTKCRDLLENKLLPLCRYFAYVQVVEEEQNLWAEYQRLESSHAQFAMRKATSADQIYPVFRDLFKKEGAKAA